MAGAARHTDPATSHAAAASVDFADAHHVQILVCLQCFGPATIYEIAERTGLNHVAVARRMKELQELFKVTPTGAERCGPTGRKCRVWRAA